MSKENERQIIERSVVLLAERLKIEPAAISTREPEQLAELMAGVSTLHKFIGLDVLAVNWAAQLGAKAVLAGQSIQVTLDQLRDMVNDGISDQSGVRKLMRRRGLPDWVHPQVEMALRRYVPVLESAKEQIDNIDAMVSANVKGRN